MLRKAAPPPGVPCVLPWRVTGPALARRLRSSLPPGDSDDPPFSAVPEKPPPARIKRRTKPSATATTTTARRAPGNGSRGGGGGDRFPVHSDLPFDFRYSYSETDPSLRPLGFREPPRFSPFGPGRLDRTWDGVSAPAPAEEKPTAAAERAAVQGAPLTESEIEELVERYRHSDCSRQINLGQDLCPPRLPPLLPPPLTACSLLPPCDFRQRGGDSQPAGRHPQPLEEGRSCEDQVPRRADAGHGQPLLPPRGARIELQRPSAVQVPSLRPR